MACVVSNDWRIVSSASGDSVHTNAERISCSMTRDYSDGPGPLLRLLAAVVKGDDVPLPDEGRSYLLDLARQHRVEHLAAWRISARGGDLDAWFGTAAGELREEARTLSVVDAVRNREIAAVLARLAE